MYLFASSSSSFLFFISIEFCNARPYPIACIPFLFLFQSSLFVTYSLIFFFFDSISHIASSWIRINVQYFT